MVGMFRLRRGQLLSAKRADIEARRRTTHQQGQSLPLHRHLSADGTGGAPIRSVGTKQSCPFGQPLVESVRPFPLVTGRGFWPKSRQKASDSF